MGLTITRREDEGVRVGDAYMLWVRLIRKASRTFGHAVVLDLENMEGDHIDTIILREGERKNVASLHRGS